MSGAGGRGGPGPGKGKGKGRGKGPAGRRALSNLGGTVRVREGGDPALSAHLKVMMEAASGTIERFTHGFHTYPARMHPDLAAEGVERLSRPGARVLDPFCGSGTVLIEARAQGRPSAGVDLNPLALRVAEVCTAVRGEAARARFLDHAGRVVDASLERVRGRVRVRAPLSVRERAFYPPHVLLELAGLFEEICTVADAPDRRALEVVFSALLVKFSRQRGDTSAQLVDKRIRKGLVSEFFLRKAGELAERWAALTEATPRPPPPVTLREGDARELREALGSRARFDLILTSPPYGGTYDYHDHHARRYPWLGIDPRRFEQREVGARRHLSQAAGAHARWDRELGGCLSSMAAVSKRDAYLVLLLGDAELDGRRVDAAEQVERLAPRAGLELRAAVSQPRRDARGGPRRREHLLLLSTARASSE
ncbi:MAG: DNA methyltransferase [Myxococcales bacterium]